MSLEEANGALKNGEYKQALELFHAILTETPDNAKAHEGVAICSVNLKDYTTALDSANKALALDPSLTLPHFALADIYRRRRKFAKAKAEINKAVELNPNSASAIYAQAIYFLWENKIDDARSFFLKAIEINPEPLATYSSHVNQGYIYRQKLDFKRALKEYQTAYNLRPSKRLSFTIWQIKHHWVISLVLIVVSLFFLALAFALNNGLLLAIYLFPLFLVCLVLMLRYLQQKRYFWLVIAALCSIASGWFIHIILFTYFTK